MSRLGIDASFGAFGALAMVVVGVLGAAAVRPASALELVPGGYGAPAGRDAARAAPEAGSLGLSGDAEATIGFTPRHVVHAWSQEAADGAEPLQFELTIGGVNGVSDPLGLTLPDGPEWLQGGRSVGGLSIGGAMRWSDWTLGGGYGRMSLMGSDVDLMSASIGWGRVSAEVAYGQATDKEPEPVDVLMLNTELEARSWLTFESNVAVGSHREQEESVAVGRFGIRLNF